MKPGIILTTGILLLLVFRSQGQVTTERQVETEPLTSQTANIKKKKRMNFFVISKPTKLLDPPTRFNILRAKIKSMLHPKKFSCIVAASAEDMSKKIQYRLEKQEAVIGSLWFDSHGAYAKGY